MSALAAKYSAVAQDAAGQVIASGDWPNEADPDCTLEQWLDAIFSSGDCVRVEITKAQDAYLAGIMQRGTSR